MPQTKIPTAMTDAELQSESRILATEYVEIQDRRRALFFEIDTRSSKIEYSQRLEGMSKEDRQGFFAALKENLKQ